MTTIKCEQCSRTEHLEDIDERLPGTWRELCAMDAEGLAYVASGRTRGVARRWFRRCDVLAD